MKTDDPYELLHHYGEPQHSYPPVASHVTFAMAEAVKSTLPTDALFELGDELTEND